MTGKLTLMTLRPNLISKDSFKGTQVYFRSKLWKIGDSSPSSEFLYKLIDLNDEGYSIIACEKDIMMAVILSDKGEKISPSSDWLRNLNLKEIGKRVSFSLGKDGYNNGVAIRRQRLGGELREIEDELSKICNNLTSVGEVAVNTALLKLREAGFEIRKIK